MRVLLDAMAAAYAGIATYTENLIAAWVEEFPEDELHVVLPAGTRWWTLPPEGVVRHELRVPWPGLAWRPLVATVGLTRLARQLEVDAVLAMNAATTLRRPSVPLAVVAHDLRHELRPDQFPWHRRVVRTIVHRNGYRNADLVVAVSHRTADDLRRCLRWLPDDRCVVVHEGSDHTDRWSRGPATGAAIAFGHHSNKNLDLILSAWQLLADTAPPLTILGLSGAIRDHVAAAVTEAGLAGNVGLAPFLPAQQFQECMTGAAMIVFPTDFEGFGLPVVEAMRLRIPVVIGPEPACLEVAGGHATVMSGWTPSDLADAVRRAAATSPAELDEARRHAETMTWACTAAGVRTAICTRVTMRDSCRGA